MNYSTLVLLTDDQNIKAIECVFGDSIYDSRYPSSSSVEKYSSKKYIYKTIDSTIQIGDLVVVQCEGVSSIEGFAIAKVVKLDAQIDYHSNTKIKWVVSKIDQEVLNETLAAEEALITQVRKAETVNKKSSTISCIRFVRQCS